jgi:ectoine hydroxylase
MNALSTEQLQGYEKDGFLVVQRVFNASFVKKLRNESTRLWDLQEIDESNLRIQWRKRVDGRKIADRIDPILDISPLFTTTAHDHRITKLAGQLLHCPQPEIFKAKLISKWPQTTGYAMHQDFSYWPGLGNAAPGDFITALLALDRSDSESGAVEIFPGLQHARLAPPANNPDDVDEQKIDLRTGVQAILQPGDMVFFHGMAPHRSGPNLSPHNRQSLFFTYITPGYDDLSRSYYTSRADDFMEPQ